MFELIYSLPETIETAIEIARTAPLFSRKISRIVVCGMGGSGIGGELLQGIYGPQVHRVLVVNKDYHLPTWIDRATLVILVSYSGNTEETLSNLAIARRNQCPTVVISTGGELLRRHGLVNSIVIPAGLPPRAAIGYLFTPLPFVLWRYGMVADPEKPMERLAKLLKSERRRIQPIAARLARWLYRAIPVIYSNSTAYHPVAYRWRCQFNENSKVFAHSHAIPEMNHNEIVGIGRPRPAARMTKLVFLDDPAASPRNKKRVAVTEELIGRDTAGVKHFSGNGADALQRAFYLIWLGDFTSYYLARLGHVDPMPVKRIEKLKARLK